MKCFIKLIAVHIVQFFIRILHIVPLKHNRILFVSYDGMQYACNPRYISEYLEYHYHGKFEIVWMLRQPGNYGFLDSRGIKVVNYNIWNKLKYGLTAKISVINAGNFYSWMPPGKSQLHIDTWHGGGYYKLCGLNESRKDQFDKRLFELASKNTSYFLSTNQCFTDNEIRVDFGYNGKVLNIGFPRNDIFFQLDNYIGIHNKVCHYFEVKNECKLLLYAPTFRYEEASKLVIPDLEKLKEAASKRFGGDWVVLTRMHYTEEIKVDSQLCYDANYRPDAPEMQELLVACDMLVSDYSSCIWDYSLTYRPCFLFTPDLDEYTENRGFGVDIYEWGFPVCKTEQKLWDEIEHYDQDEFRNAMERHHENLGSFEHGNATEIMGKLIYDHCFPES